MEFPFLSNLLYTVLELSGRSQGETSPVPSLRLREDAQCCILPVLALFLFVKAFSKYFSFLFLFLMHVPQKKGMNQTSPVSASKAQDNLRQHQLSSLLSNTLSGQPWSFKNHSVVRLLFFFAAAAIDSFSQCQACIAGSCL